MRDEGVAATASLLEGLLEHLQRLAGVTGLEQRRGQKSLPPDALEIGAGLAGDLDSLARAIH